MIGPLFAISAPSTVRPEIGLIRVRALKILLFQVTQINLFKKKRKYKSQFNRKLFENQYIGPIKFSRETGVSRPGILVVRALTQGILFGANCPVQAIYDLESLRGCFGVSYHRCLVPERIFYFFNQPMSLIGYCI